MSPDLAKADQYMNLLGKSVLANRRLRGKGVIRDDEVMALSDVLRDWRAFYNDGDRSPKTAKEIIERARALELRFRERGLKFITEPDGHEALAVKLNIAGAAPAARKLTAQEEARIGVLAQPAIDAKNLAEWQVAMCKNGPEMLAILQSTGSYQTQLRELYDALKSCPRGTDAPGPAQPIPGGVAQPTTSVSPEGPGRIGPPKGHEQGIAAKVQQGQARAAERARSGAPGGAPAGPAKGPTVSPFGVPGGRPGGMPGGAPGSRGHMPWGRPGWSPFKMPWWAWALAGGAAYLAVKD